ncbi:hypothetical protein DEO72_LG1g2036 [Vigna unguiculata]|uniref:Uncharacterized protein n=1 Tax=Vigna unguiculata TaxID=3917 RepID=A0A4D6KPG9_VIGUN|nr:hypothetical protein DEO72_LG1g2036 [Vigna unguiculata]
MTRSYQARSFYGSTAVTYSREPFTQPPLPVWNVNLSPSFHKNHGLSTSGVSVATVTTTVTFVQPLTAVKP